MLRLIKQLFMGLLINIINASNHTKCISLKDQQCMIQPTLINFHANECCEGLFHCPFGVNLDRCVRSCNNLSDLSNELCVSYKI